MRTVPPPLFAFMRSRYILPGVVAIIQIAGSFHERSHQPNTRAMDALALALLLAGPAALTVRRWWPREVLGSVLLVTVAYHFLDYPDGPVSAALVVAFIATFFHGYRAFAWAMLGLTYFSVFWLGYLIGIEPRPELDAALGAAAWMLVFFGFFELGRGRRERFREEARARHEASKRRASEERLRIARELHDVLGHNLSLINVQAGTALHLMEERPEQARTALAAIKDASNEALFDLRSVLDILREGGEDAPRAPLPTLKDMDDLVERTSVAGLTVTKEVVGTARSLGASVERAAYRIVQEALTNVTRHASASQAVVKIEYGEDVLVLEILDNGRAPGTFAEGNGIGGMRERAEALGGALGVGPAGTKGFRVQARLPVEKHS